MDLVLFGTGMFMKKRLYQLNKHRIVAFLDNNSNIWGKDYEGIPIYNPETINKLSYDKIILMSTYEYQMKKQLTESLGIESNEIMGFYELIGEENKYHLEIFYPPDAVQNTYKGSVLLITTEMNYNGGTVACVYAAKALKMRGYDAVIVAPRGDSLFIRETNEQGITVYLYENLNYCDEMELGWAQGFSYVVVNTLQMVRLVSLLSQKQSVLWWIHESKEVYDYVLKKNPYYLKENLSNVLFCPVCETARRNFEQFFPEARTQIIHYGIPDKADLDCGTLKNKEKLVFALIGVVSEVKAQDIFCEAIAMLDETEAMEAEFRIIGKADPESVFGSKIIQMTKKAHNIKMMGCLSRKQMEEIYDSIDVIVCPSREDNVPIVLTEGFMYSKVCIISGGVGTAEYIEAYKNGLICETGSAVSLCDQMRWILNHKEELELIGQNARTVYETYFSMELFAERLEDALVQGNGVLNGRIG